MKCAVHNDEDAIGVCRTCGAGVCTVCRVVIAGLTYCNSCLESGRYRPPGITPIPEEAPTPIPPGYTGITNPVFFKLAIIGALLFGVAVHLLWISEYLRFTIWFYMLGTFIDPVFAPKTVAFAIFGVGMTLVGFAFHGYRSQFGSRTSLVAGTLSFVSAWWLLIADLLQYTGLVWTSYNPWYYYEYSPGPLHLVWYNLHLIGLILYCTTLILWSASILETRRLTRQNRLSMWSAILFLVAVHLILIQLPFYSQLLIYYSFYILSPYLFTLFIIPACFVESACIIAAILFNRSRTSMKIL
ncbi:MAG: B-box zinc finger protein [Promethearchaeota archaeon]